MAKIIKGGVFGGCVRYVMGKQDAELLAANGVLLENKQSVIDNFEAQSQLNPRLRRKVGHISLNFSMQDKAKIDNQFMLKVAGEYMQRMGIINTQCIVVRHSDRDHPHCHIVFNRVDNEGKTISDKNDRLRSVKACRAITERHGLYIAGGKENVNRQQLRNPDSVKYAIYDTVKVALPHCQNWDDLERQLAKDGIALTFKYSGGTDIKQGVIFGKDGQSFNGSKIDRAFSFSKLDAALNANARRQEIREGRASPVGNESRISPEREAREIRDTRDVVPQTSAQSSASLPLLGHEPQTDHRQYPDPQPEHEPHIEHRQHSVPSHSYNPSGDNIFSGVGFDPSPGEKDNTPPKPKKKVKKRPGDTT